MMKIQSFEDFQATRKWTEDLEKATGYTVAEMPEAGENLHGFTYDDGTLYIIANGGCMAPALIERVAGFLLMIATRIPNISAGGEADRNGARFQSAVNAR